MGISTKAGKLLLKEIARDYNNYQKRLFTNLVSQTPIASGQAQRGWKEKAKMGDVIKQGDKKVVIRNDIPYIERLDKGWSSQAKAIVKPVLNRTRKP